MEWSSASSFLVLLLVPLTSPFNPNLDSAISNDVIGWELPLERKPKMGDDRGDDPEIHMDVYQIIRYHGYPAEQYNVTTMDGYILTIHRIPHGKKSPPTPAAPRPPVLVQHGLFCSSAIWVVNTPDKNLPYLLADAGYDVWLGNVRGNTYGRRHVSLSPKQKEFWMFSFDEMAHFDLPAVIDFLLNATGFNATFYVGHSMGTTIPFALLSSRPEYNAKIRSLMALAPVATCTHIRSPIRYLEPYAYDLALVADMFGDYELLPSSRVLKFFSRTVCKWSVRALCYDIMFLLVGFDSTQFNATRLPVYTSHIPAGASVQTLLHYAQMGLKDGFWYFDYGAKGNLEKYGQPTPPMYNVSKITTPVALFWSENDYLADKQDVDELTGDLKSLVLKYKVPYDLFNHVDFTWAIDVKPLLYNKVLSVLGKLARKKSE